MEPVAVQGHWEGSPGNAAVIGKRNTGCDGATVCCFVSGGQSRLKFLIFYLLLVLQGLDGVLLESNLQDVALRILQCNCPECIIIENAS